MAACLRRSVAVLPPTHFLTLRPGRPGTPDGAFTDAITKFIKALKRRCPDKRLEYLVVNEWRGGARHAHALVRLGAPMSDRATRRAVKQARRVAGVRCSWQTVRSVPGAANYIFKHTKRPDGKAELTPRDFTGRMYTVSSRFLTAPFKQLWRAVKSAALRKRVNAAASDTEPASARRASDGSGGRCPRVESPAESG